ncbi:hypothetical protein MXB_3183, partial [Myxobolus squamalis]
DPRFDHSKIDQFIIQFDTKENDDIAEPAPKKRSYSDQKYGVHPIKPSLIIMELNAILKPELRALLNVCLKLQVWIQLLIPKIEDGNNFGVSVQEALLEEVGRVQQDVGAYLDQFSRYHANRAKLISKVLKYPHIHSLLDVLIKNYQKVICPRSDHHGSIYTPQKGGVLIVVIN